MRTSYVKFSRDLALTLTETSSTLYIFGFTSTEWNNFTGKYSLLLVCVGHFAHLKAKQFASQ